MRYSSRYKRKISWLSYSPYVKTFEKLDEVHHNIDEKTLVSKMNEINYELTKNQWFDLPNGKKFIRLDFKKKLNLI